MLDCSLYRILSQLQTMNFYPELRIQHYVLINPIAEGGMGTVWRGWDDLNKVFVAIKSVSNDLLEDVEFKSRFIDEIRRHSRLNHPNIVKIFDAFEYGGASCCVMEYIEGTSLEELIHQAPNRRLEINQTKNIANDILSALDYAHRHGIIHRDIKPSNILLDKQGHAHLIDFGIALAVGEKRRTRTGQFVGTPFYMSPEQIKTPKQIDHLSDVYSLGCVLYEALIGDPPFTSKSPQSGSTYFDVRQSHVNDTPVPLRKLRPEISDYLNDLIMSALAKEPYKRPPGCGVFMQQLTQTNNDGFLANSGSKSKRGWLLLLVIAIFAGIAAMVFTER